MHGACRLSRISAAKRSCAERNSKNFRSLDKVQMNGRLPAELRTLPLRADESEARSGAHGWGQAGQSAKLTERSEACACAGVGLVGEADSKRPPHRAERIAKLCVAVSSPPAGGEQRTFDNVSKVLLRSFWRSQVSCSDCRHSAMLERMTPPFVACKDDYTILTKPLTSAQYLCIIYSMPKGGLSNES